MFKKKISIILLSALAVLLAACGSGTAKRGPTPTPIPPVVNYDKAIFTVERGPIVSEKHIYAEVVPARQDELYFKSSGFASRVSVKQGNLAKAGDVLAEQQIDDLFNQLQQAKIDLEVNQANLSSYNAKHQYDIEKANSDVIILEKQAALASISYAQALGLDKERAKLNLEIAQQNLLLAQQALQLVTEDVNPYMEQAVKRSELSVQRLEGLIAERQIIAPYDCIILKSMVRPGQEVSAYYNIFTIGDPTNLIIRSNYDYDLANMMTKDSDVKMYLHPDDEQGYAIQFVPNFMPFSDTTSEKESGVASTDYLYFSLPTDLPKDQIPLGRTITLVIVLGKKDDVLLLPPAAIREYKGLNFVIVLDGDRRRRVEIEEVGLKGTDRWEVVGDLNEGDQVLGP
jgi:HlyD family secretion protein